MKKKKKTESGASRWWDLIFLMNLAQGGSDPRDMHLTHALLIADGDNTFLLTFTVTNHYEFNTIF